MPCQLLGQVAMAPIASQFPILEVTEPPIAKAALKFEVLLVQAVRLQPIAISFPNSVLNLEFIEFKLVTIVAKLVTIEAKFVAIVVEVAIFTQFKSTRLARLELIIRLMVATQLVMQQPVQVFIQFLLASP